MKKTAILIMLLLLISCDKEPGPPGPQGPPGHNSLIEIVNTASGCPTGGITFLSAVDLNDNGIIDPLLDGNFQSAQVCNGLNAPPTPYTPVQIIDPCGDAPGIYDEVLLKLNNGIIIASFSDNTNGNNTRFSVLSSGAYMTTDGSRCYFRVDSDGNIYDEHY